MPTCLTAALVLVSAADSTPARPITQLVHTRWTVNDGAPAGIRDLVQTADGYLWVGTMSGLVRFDGVRFVPFAPRSGDALPLVGVRRLLTARDGSLWIVWRNGEVSRYHAGRLTSYGEKDGLPATFVLTESSTGTLVAGTETGLAQLVNRKWKDVSREWQYPGTTARAAWFDRDDALWAQTADRIVYLPSGSRQFIDPGMPRASAPASASRDQPARGVRGRDVRSDSIKRVASAVGEGSIAIALVRQALRE